MLKKLQQEITAQPIDLVKAEQVVIKGHKDIENMVSEQAITLIKNENAALSIKTAKSNFHYF